MSLDSLLASLENDVTNVTRVTASTGAGSGCNVMAKSGVTHVTPGNVGGRFVTPVTPRNGTDVTPKPAWIKAVTPVTCVTSENGNVQETTQKRSGTTMGNFDPATEARRQRVLDMLHRRPGIRYAVVVADPDADPVIVSVAIRSVASFELEIPQAYYDAFALLELIEKHTTEQSLTVGSES